MLHQLWEARVACTPVDWGQKPVTQKAKNLFKEYDPCALAMNCLNEQSRQQAVGGNTDINI